MAVLFSALFFPTTIKFDLAKLLPKWVYKKKKPKFAISSQFFISFFLQCADITWYSFKVCVQYNQVKKNLCNLYYTLMSGSGPKILLRESGAGKVGSWPGRVPSSCSKKWWMHFRGGQCSPFGHQIICCCGHRAFSAVLIPQSQSLMTGNVFLTYFIIIISIVLWLNLGFWLIEKRRLLRNLIFESYIKEK